AGADNPDSNLSADGVWHQEFPDFSSRRSFSSSRSRLYLVGSSIVRAGGAIGLRIFAIKPPARCFFGLRCGIRLRGEAHKAHLQAGGFSAGRAPRKKPSGGASSARTDASDVRRRESGALELVAHDSAQVDKRLAGPPGAGMIPRAGNLAAEAIAQLGVNLETTLADRRAHRGANVGGVGTDLDHRTNARAGDVCDDATPSGVQRAGHFALRIDHQDRNAIGREYSQHDARLGGDDP